MAGLVTAPRTERLEASVIVAAMQTLEWRRQLALGPVDLVVIERRIMPSPRCLAANELRRLASSLRVLAP